VAEVTKKELLELELVKVALDHNPHLIVIRLQEQVHLEILEQVMVLLVFLFHLIMQTAPIIKVVVEVVLILHNLVVLEMVVQA
jgi:hypothetical protein|tara:strand:+ start:325 stop:573 length:249 start_codon:yes stop_codon:yes gene_type:complete